MKATFFNVLENIKKITKNQPIDIWFFILFLLTFTLSIRKVLFYFPIQGTFNEYSGIYLYLSDIFLILAISVWLFTILCNINTNLSNIKLWIRSLYAQRLLILPLALVIWSFMTIIWSQNQTIAIFRSIKLLELYFLYLYLIFRFIPKLFHVEQFKKPKIQAVRKENYSKIPNLSQNNSTKATLLSHCSTPACSVGRWNIFIWIIIFIAIAQSSIGIVQFISQESLGLTFLKESVLSQNMPGVAKIVIDGEKYIRTYGLFPHPNIFGGFLLFSVTLTLLLAKMFQFQSTPINCSTCLSGRQAWNNFNISTKILATKCSKLLLSAFLFIMLFDHYFWDIQQGSFMLWIIFGLIVGLKLNRDLSPDCFTKNVPPARNATKITQQKISEDTKAAYFKKINRNFVAGGRGTIVSNYALNGSFDFFPKKYPGLIGRILWFALGLQILALLLTFSKSAIFGGFVAMLLFHVEQLKKLPGLVLKVMKIKPAQKNKQIALSAPNKLFHVEQSQEFKLALGLIMLIAIFFIFLRQTNFNFFVTQPINERIEYLNVSRGTISKSPILGVGAGQSVLRSQDFSQKVLEPYQYQPVHNVFLLIWSELGIVGLTLFILFLKELFHTRKA
jgi:hypothetical protein